MSWRPIQFLIAMCAGSLQRRQQALVEYLIEENLVVHPDALLRWYRKLIAQKYDGSKNRGPGRLRISPPLEALAVKVVREARTCGYRRICGIVKNLGFENSPNAIKRSCSTTVSILRHNVVSKWVGVAS